VETLDVNSDGDRDLAVSAQRLNVLLGLGPGDFGLFTPLDAQVDPANGLVATRLNGDRDQDLAMVDDQFDPARVTVMLSRGDGTFRAPRHRRAGGGPFDLAAGDFDGDGKRDLATSDGTQNRLSVLFGRGGGRFRDARRVNVGSETARMAAGDLNGDGRDDLVAASFAGEPVLSLAYGRADRSFRTPPDPELDVDPFAVDIADLDGDGRRDIVVTNPDSETGDDSVSILWGKRRGFTPPATFSLGAATIPQSLTLEDLNADGRRDLAVGNVGDSVSVFENTGPRTFATPLSFPVGDGPQDIEAARIDGDALPDLVTANDSSDDVSVLINGP
jgi:hypothetical protein